MSVATVVHVVLFNIIIFLINRYIVLWEALELWGTFILKYIIYYFLCLNFSLALKKIKLKHQDPEFNAHYDVFVIVNVTVVFYILLQHIFYVK